MNSTKIILLAFFIFLAYGIASAGSAAAILKGESESGRTKLNIVISDISDEVIKAELIIDGVSLSFGEECKSYTIADLKNGVYTISIELVPQLPDVGFSSSKWLEFWAIPSTFEKGADCRTVYKFKAKVRASDPRSESGLETPDIELNCTLEYCI